MLGGGMRQKTPRKLLKALDEALQRYENNHPTKTIFLWLMDHYRQQTFPPAKNGGILPLQGACSN
jgi:hypothetical protein